MIRRWAVVALGVALAGTGWDATGWGASRAGATARGASERGAAAGGSDEQIFPHARHAGLFPTCLGCHAGILDASAPRFPTVQQCAGCHDGRQEKPVRWVAPAPRPTNLHFSHLEHEAEAKLGEPATNCRECHAQPGTTAFMAVQRAAPQPCISCHGHPAPAHLADESPCGTCHVPLARAVAIADSTIAHFPRPASHDRRDFLETHGPSVPDAQSRCAVCHARESCERCHANAARIPAIAAIARDPRMARLAAARPAAYPEPASHQRAEWSYAHGGEARRRIQSCANCHAQPSCRSCHIGPLGGDAIRQLPEGAESGPHGVELRGRDPRWTPPPPARQLLRQVSARRRVPSASWRADTNPPLARPGAREVRVHPLGFATAHGAAAASRQATCAGCHERRFCSDCHDGEGTRRFHPPDFVQRHPADAYRRQRDCATCHNPEVFCSGCHEGVGLRSRGRIDVAFHTAQPLWLLQHGRAARQGMESCTTCHVQQDCMRCHSTTGWGVNPHGPGFNAGRMQGRNRITCRYCHLSDPG